jgi:hypothetical protein
MAQQLLKQDLSLSEFLARREKQLTKNIRKPAGKPFSNNELAKEETSVSQIIRTYGKQFTQIRKQYTDGHGGRCVMGVIMSYYGWDGKCVTNSERRLYAALVALRRTGISQELLIEMNDSGATFDEIADYLEKIENR